MSLATDWRRRRSTHFQLQDHLRSLVDAKVAEQPGHVVKNTGDGMLAEIGSVVDATRFAVDIQHGMLEHNATVLLEKLLRRRRSGSNGTPPAQSIPNRNRMSQKNVVTSNDKRSWRDARDVCTFC